MPVVRLLAVFASLVLSPVKFVFCVRFEDGAVNNHDAHAADTTQGYDYGIVEARTSSDDDEARDEFHQRFRDTKGPEAKQRDETSSAQKKGNLTGLIAVPVSIKEMEMAAASSPYDYYSADHHPNLLSREAIREKKHKEASGLHRRRSRAYLKHQSTIQEKGTEARKTKNKNENVVERRKSSMTENGENKRDYMKGNKAKDKDTRKQESRKIDEGEHQREGKHGTQSKIRKDKEVDAEGREFDKTKKSTKRRKGKKNFSSGSRPASLLAKVARVQANISETPQAPSPAAALASPSEVGVAIENGNVTNTNNTNNSKIDIDVDSSKLAFIKETALMTAKDAQDAIDSLEMVVAKTQKTVADAATTHESAKVLKGCKPEASRTWTSYCALSSQRSEMGTGDMVLVVNSKSCTITMGLGEAMALGECYDNSGEDSQINCTVYSRNGLHCQSPQAAQATPPSPLATAQQPSVVPEAKGPEAPVAPPPAVTPPSQHGTAQPPKGGPEVSKSETPVAPPLAATQPSRSGTAQQVIVAPVVPEVKGAETLTGPPSLGGTAQQPSVVPEAKGPEAPVGPPSAVTPPSQPGTVQPPRVVPEANKSETPVVPPLAASQPSRSGKAQQPIVEPEAKGTDAPTAPPSAAIPPSLTGTSQAPIVIPDAKGPGTPAISSSVAIPAMPSGQAPPSISVPEAAPQRSPQATLPQPLDPKTHSAFYSTPLPDSRAATAPAAQVPPGLPPSPLPTQLGASSATTALTDRMAQTVVLIPSQDHPSASTPANEKDGMHHESAIGTDNMKLAKDEALIVRPSDANPSNSTHTGVINDEPDKSLLERGILMRHNLYRCMHGVPKLKWNPSIAENAARWARTTRENMEHSATSSRSNIGGFEYVGENIVWGRNMVGSPGVDQWYSEILTTTNQEGTIDETNETLLNHVGHFSQVIWKESTEVGCGTSGMLLVCQYGPGGNKMGQYKFNVLPKSTKSMKQCEAELSQTTAPAKAKKKDSRIKKQGHLPTVSRGSGRRKPNNELERKMRRKHRKGHRSHVAHLNSKETGGDASGGHSAASLSGGTRTAGIGRAALVKQTAALSAKREVERHKPVDPSASLRAMSAVQESQTAMDPTVQGDVATDMPEESANPVAMLLQDDLNAPVSTRASVVSHAPTAPTAELAKVLARAAATFAKSPSLSQTQREDPDSHMAALAEALIPTFLSLGSLNRSEMKRARSFASNLKYSLQACGGVFDSAKEGASLDSLLESANDATPVETIFSGHLDGPTEVNSSSQLTPARSASLLDFGTSIFEDLASPWHRFLSLWSPPSETTSADRRDDFVGDASTAPSAAGPALVPMTAPPSSLLEVSAMERDVTDFVPELAPTSAQTSNVASGPRSSPSIAAQLSELAISAEAEEEEALAAAALQQQGRSLLETTDTKVAMVAGKHASKKPKSNSASTNAWAGSQVAARLAAKVEESTAALTKEADAAILPASGDTEDAAADRMVAHAQELAKQATQLASMMYAAAGSTTAQKELQEAGISAEDDTTLPPSPPPPPQEHPQPGVKAPLVVKYADSVAFPAGMHSKPTKAPIMVQYDPPQEKPPPADTIVVEVNENGPTAAPLYPQPGPPVVVEEKPVTLAPTPAEVPEEPPLATSGWTREQSAVERKPAANARAEDADAEQELAREALADKSNSLKQTHDTQDDRGADSIAQARPDKKRSVALPRVAGETSVHDKPIQRLRAEASTQLVQGRATPLRTDSTTELKVGDAARAQDTRVKSQTDGHGEEAHVTRKIVQLGEVVDARAGSNFVQRGRAEETGARKKISQVKPVGSSSPEYAFQDDELLKIWMGCIQRVLSVRTLMPN
eukprot:TRINITY_DN8386_c0_g1_i1.p1 TRINITY_DN8386_c0_g1~~TRINITY_DN8386_c0_g1_i1.p1  ORF type:complete len:1843 (-),score=334.00 TRINITY_DN8386_c0_g1_i1:58-5586(-)